MFGSEKRKNRRECEAFLNRLLEHLRNLGVTMEDELGGYKSSNEFSQHWFEFRMDKSGDFYIIIFSFKRHSLGEIDNPVEKILWNKVLDICQVRSRIYTFSYHDPHKIASDLFNCIKKYENWISVLKSERMEIQQELERLKEEKKQKEAEWKQEEEKIKSRSQEIVNKAF